MHCVQRGEILGQDLISSLGLGIHKFERMGENRH